MSDVENSIFYALRRSALLTSLVGGTLSFMPLAPTFAQPQDSAAASGALEEVIVTAERRETDLQHTAISVVALDAQAIEQRGITNLGDLARMTPSLSTVSDIENSRPVFLIRGVGNTSGRETQETGVALYVDDIYMARSNGAYLQLVDVDRVEVLRGPQGTLFGRNASGGAIRYITRKPTQDFEASASATVGSYNRQDLTGMLNIPFSATIAGRFQFGTFKEDGYIHNLDNNAEGGGVDDTAARGVLRFTPTDDLTVDVGTTYMRSKRDRPALVVLANNNVDPQARALNARLIALGQAPLANNDTRYVLPDKYQSSGACYVGVNTMAATVGVNNRTIFGDSNYCDDTQEQTTSVSFLDANWALPAGFAVRSLTGYVDGKSFQITDGGGLGVIRQLSDSDYNTLSQELQLKYSSDRLNAVAGLYYSDEDTTRFIYSGRLSQAPATLGQCCEGDKTTPSTETESKGVFAQVTFDLTNQLQLIAGGRYSEDSKSIAIVRSDRPTAAPGTLITNEGEWSDSDYRVTVQYQFTPSFMLYTTASTGYKAGGFNDAVAAAPATAGGLYPYDPETVDSYEVGMKSQWFDNQLRFNLTGFYMNYEDMQLSTPLIDPLSGQTTVVVQNAGRIRLSGIEAEVAWRATDNLTLSGSVSTIDQEIRSLVNGSGLLIGRTCSPPFPQTFATCQAQPIAAAPEYQYSVSAGYVIPFSRADLSFDATYAYTDSKYTLNSAAASYLIPAYGLANARVTYEPRDARWSVALYANNITDKYYLLTGQNGTGAFGTVTGVVGRPREAGLQVKFTY